MRKVFLPSFSCHTGERRLLIFCGKEVGKNRKCEHFDLNCNIKQTDILFFYKSNNDEGLVLQIVALSETLREHLYNYIARTNYIRTEIYTPKRIEIKIVPLR